MKIKICSILILFALLFFTGCGGIGGTGGTVEEEDIEPSLKRSVTGLISQKKSSKNEIIVSGSTYKLSGSVIKRNNEIVGEDSLLVGQRVKINAREVESDGAFDVEEITVDESLIGPVRKTDVANNTLIVLGVNVVVSDSTLFVGRELSELLANNLVAVFGVIGVDGSIEASLIEFIKEDFDSARDTVTFEGRLDISEAEDSSMVSNSLVDSSVSGAPATADDFEVRVDSIGRVVEIEGVSLDVFIDRLRDFSPPKTDSSAVKNLNKVPAVVEGYIFNLNAGVSFDVANAHVILKGYVGETVFVDGDYVVVNGVFDESGNILLKQVQVRRANDFVLKGAVEAVDIVSQKIQVLGNSFYINDKTVMAIDEGLLTVGASIFINGYKNDNGQLVISFLKSIVVPESTVRGVVQKIEDGLVVISGMQYFYNEDSVFNFNNAESESGFAESLKVGLEVDLLLVLTEGAYVISEGRAVALSSKVVDSGVGSNSGMRGPKGFSK